MQKFKMAIYRAAFANTLISLLLYAVYYLYTKDGKSGKLDSNLLSIDTVLVILLYSLLLGFSFYIFDIKKLPNSAKRIIHVILNLVTMILCFFVLRGAMDNAVMIFGSVFIYLLSYVICSLIGTLFGKISAK